MAMTSTQLIASAKSRIREISLADFDELIKQDGVVLVDVRDDYEFSSDHIPHAIHLSRGTLEFSLDKQSDSFAKELSDARCLIMVCGSGSRSALAASTALQMGWNAISLAGGMKGWKSAGRNTKSD